MNSNSELRAFLAVDDLRVGGIQRLVMDEAYALSDEGYKVHIVNFGGVRENDSIIHVDEMLVEKLLAKSISITNMPSGKYLKWFKLKSFMIENELNSVICHSPSASFWFRMAALSCFRQVKISLWIHQVLTLSDWKQALKRVILSTTADKIYFSAVQFKLEWEANLADRVIRQFKSDQIRVVDRLGVYIPRVLSNAGGFDCEPVRTHLIFASRLTSWKGLKKFDRIIERNPHYHPIVLTVNVPNDLTLSILHAETLEGHLLICKSPNYVANQRNTVHIYPTDYGKKVKNPQSIGLNVMEFTVLGIPSLISPEVTSTYPEILNSILVESVDWQDSELVDKKIISLANLTQSERKNAALQMQGICSIQNHLATLKRNL